jgi:hypothetical protein
LISAVPKVGNICHQEVLQVIQRIILLFSNFNNIKTGSYLNIGPEAIKVLIVE